MKITRYDSPLRWLVQSESRPNISHLVDLGESGEVGQCTCEHYQCHIAPEIEAGRAVLRCKHIRAVREKLLSLVIKKLKDNERP